MQNYKKNLICMGGTSIRSFIHIDDVSEGIMKILEHGSIGNLPYVD